jgi:hypothetical protein
MISIRCSWIYTNCIAVGAERGVTRGDCYGAPQRRGGFYRLDAYGFSGSGGLHLNPNLLKLEQIYSCAIFRMYHHLCLLILICRVHQQKYNYQTIRSKTFALLRPVKISPSTSINPKGKTKRFRIIFAYQSIPCALPASPSDKLIIPAALQYPELYQRCT